MAHHKLHICCDKRCRLTLTWTWNIHLKPFHRKLISEHVMEQSPQVSMHDCNVKYLPIIFSLALQQISSVYPKCCSELDLFICFFVFQVNKTSIAWSLGYMLALSNMIPAEGKITKLPINNVLFTGLLLLFSTLTVITLTYLVIALVRFCYWGVCTEFPSIFDWVLICRTSVPLREVLETRRDIDVSMQMYLIEKDFSFGTWRS